VSVPPSPSTSREAQPQKGRIFQISKIAQPKEKKRLSEAL
jgi:hypothetical protein